MDTAVETAAVEPIQVPLFAWVATAAAAFLLYLVLSENGAVLAQSWHTMHELFHDGRHFVAVPCH